MTFLAYEHSQIKYTKHFALDIKLHFILFCYVKSKFKLSWFHHLNNL